MWKKKHESWANLKLPQSCPWYQQQKNRGGFIEYDAAQVRLATQNHNKCCFLFSIIFVCDVRACICVQVCVEARKWCQVSNWCQVYLSIRVLFVYSMQNQCPHGIEVLKMVICSSLAEPFKNYPYKVALSLWMACSWESRVRKSEGATWFFLQFTSHCLSLFFALISHSQLHLHICIVHSKGFKSDKKGLPTHEIQ